MKIASVLENQKIEKRISITPETAKKYIELGFQVSLTENYAKHLGINDLDYTDLGVKIYKDEIHTLLDHKYLNDIEELSNPTTEHIAKWIWNRIQPNLSGLTGVTVSEGPSYSCTYRGA